MKRILLLLLIFSTLSISAQLNSNAKLIKEKLPNEYHLIKLIASEDWEGDHRMMLYTINNQADAYIKVLEFSKAPNYDKAIFKNALSEWSKLIKGENCTDWKMVAYTYKNQLKAKSEY